MAKASRANELNVLSSPCEISRSPQEYYSLRAQAGSTSDSPHNPPKAGVGEVAVSSKRKRSRTSLGLKRKSRVKKGVCGDVKVKSTRKKLAIKANAPSTIKSKILLLPSKGTNKGNSSPTKVVIKANPLFKSDATYRTRSFRHLAEGENKCGNIENDEDTDGFKGQKFKIRKTKEKEMISAIMGISKCDSKNDTSVFRKIKNRMGSRKGGSDISTSAVWSPKTSGKTHTLKYPLSPKMTEMEQILTQI